MTRVHFVKRANKDYPDQEIKKGESYYWWKFRHGSKRMSKARPRRSQLTQSEFLGVMYDLEDETGDVVGEFRDGKIAFEDLASSLEDIAGRVREAGEECESKRSNMPDALQDGDTGQLLETRSEQCDAIADELGSAAQKIRDLEPDDHESKGDDEEGEGRREDAATAAEGVGWDFE